MFLWRKTFSWVEGLMEREEEELESFWPRDKDATLDFLEENKLQTFMFNVNSPGVAELPTGLFVPVPTHLKGLAEGVAKLCVELETTIFR